MLLKFAPNEISGLVAGQWESKEWFPTVVALASTPGAHPLLLMVKTAKAKPREVPSWMPPQRGMHQGETCADAAQRVLREEVGLESAIFVGYKGHCLRALSPGRRLTEKGWDDAQGRLMVYVHLQIDEHIGILRPKDPSIADCKLVDAGQYSTLIRTSSAGKRLMTEAALDRSRVFGTMSEHASA